MMVTTQVKTVKLIADLEQAYFDYAVETITDRALPRVEDGLKPVQRRILYAMHSLGLHHSKPHKKSARVVGEVLGKYHPHGDSSVYGAMVRMAQDFSLGHTLVDGQGNFGSIDGDAPAAMRYTEARLAPVTEAMLQDVGQNAVDWVENFDGSLKEPVILPAILPNLLVNGSSGVAVGMATNIPPHNLGEICDALVYLVKRWAKRDRVKVDELLRFVPGPDFPTGGVAYRYRIEPGHNGEDDSVEDTIRAAYSTGRGRIVTQARLSIEATRGGKADIIVTELPYTVQKSTVLERIAAEVRAGRIEGVTDLRDESDFTGMRLVIEVSRLADPGQVLESLLTYTQLRQTFGVTNLALVEEEGEVVPKLLSLREMLDHFIAHRLTIIERRSRYELAEREARLHIVAGLLKALDVIDEVIATIKRSKSTGAALTNLTKQFKFSETQARAILEMQLRRLAALERQKLQVEDKKLRQRIKYLQELLAAEAKRLAVIIEETMAIKKTFATPRCTVILDNEQQAAGMGAATVTELVKPKGPQVVVITTRGILRSPADHYTYKVKPGVSSRAVEAHLVQLRVEAENTVCLVSNRGRVWKAAVGQVPDNADFAELGLDKGETLVGGGVVTPGHYLLIGTRTGNIKRIKVEDLPSGEAIWTRMIGLSEPDEVLFAAAGSDQVEVLFFTAEGKAIRFAGGKVNAQTTPVARGVIGIKLRQGDRLVAGAVVEPDDKAQVIVISQAGFVKRVKLVDFPRQGRGGQGVQSLEVNKTSGKVAAAAVAAERSTHCDILSAKSSRHRLKLTILPLVDRRKRGEKLVDIDDIAQVVIG